MRTEQEQSPTEKSPRDIFLDALNEELFSMENSGRISSEQAAEKRRAASLIEEGFSDDPKKDALLFAVAGIGGEEEIIKIIGGSRDKKSKK